MNSEEPHVESKVELKTEPKPGETEFSLQVGERGWTF